MVEAQYEVMQVGEPKFPPMSLIKIAGDRNLITRLDAFGPNTFDENVAEMQKTYSHPDTGRIITFREPTTAESIIALPYDFANRKRKILDPLWLQLGRIARTSEGVFVNLPKRDAQGKLITDEQTLKSFLTSDKKDKGIYLLDGDFGYAGYETFRQGVQDAGDFIEGGLARVLNHSQSPEQLKEIASKKNYPLGVDVRGFDPGSELALRVAGLGSVTFGGRRLGVGGDDWYDFSSGDFGGDYYLGFAFGVLK